MSKKNELVRIQSLIENDRLSTVQNFEELIVSDLHKILSDYFEYRGVPNLKISNCGKVIGVEISLLATAIKNFATIPKN